MRRDPYSTVTGWVWLDKLTLPFWTVYCAIQKHLLYRQIGGGDRRLGEQLFRQAVHDTYDPVYEAQRILEENR